MLEICYYNMGIAFLRGQNLAFYAEREDYKTSNKTFLIYLLLVECVGFFPVKGSRLFSMHLFPFSVISHGRGPRPLLCFDPLNDK